MMRTKSNEKTVLSEYNGNSIEFTLVIVGKFLQREAKYISKYSRFEKFDSKKKVIWFRSLFERRICGLTDDILQSEATWNRGFPGIEFLGVTKRDET